MFWPPKFGTLELGTFEFAMIEFGMLESEFRTASPIELAVGCEPAVGCELALGCELFVGFVTGLFCALVAEFVAGWLGFAKGFVTDFATDFPAEGVTELPADRPPAVLFFAMATAFSAVIIDRTPVFIGQLEFLGKSACNRLARTEHLNIL